MVKHPNAIPLTPVEERRLAKTIEAGVLAQHLLDAGEWSIAATADELEALVTAGTTAFQEFLLSYLRFVGQLAASESRRCGIATEELFQEGFLALAETLQRFDYQIGRFSTYAMVRVKQRLAEVGATRMGSMELPPTRALKSRRAWGLMSELGQHLSWTARVSEVAQLLGVKPQQVVALLGHTAPVGIEGLAETLPDGREPVPEQQIFNQQCRQYVANLPTRKAEVLRLRFGLDSGDAMTATQAAKHLGITIRALQQLERAALAELRPLLA